MPTNWRGLFDEVGVSWIDRGPNVIRDDIAINCPLCGNDPSEHMNFGDNGYYCLRNPSQHKGTNFLYVMRRLLPHVSRMDMLALLNRHATTQMTTRARVAHTPTDVERLWSSFLPAAEHQSYLDYLAGRGFDNPDVVCRRYDLRYARIGEWAARLLIPIIDSNGTVISWTGRTIRHLEPRYKNLTVEFDSLIYMPRAMRATALLVEGSIDAIKSAEATLHSNISPIGILGVGINPDRLKRIVDAVRNCRQILVCLDADILYPIGDIKLQYGAMTPTPYRGLIFALAKLLPLAIIRRIPLPGGSHDLGETPVARIAQHLTEVATGVLQRREPDVRLTVSEYLKSIQR